MINMLLGPPGAGKSYEAVVFHVLPALLSGRKVITNLPLQVDSFRSYGVDISLIDLRHPTAMNPKPFASLDDYGDDWRGDGGVGPLYVIDECHKSLPKGIASRQVEEWYAEHRHEGADILLITQSYGKISNAIRDMVQVVYRVRKATALGSDKKYIRKVQDGLRGEVMNESIRTYNPKRFKLYKSHTKTQGAVLEASASDVKPIWRHWSVIGSALLLPIGLVSLLFTAGDALTADDEVPVDKTAMVSVPSVLPGASFSNPKIDAPADPVKKVNKKDHPFKKLGLHIQAYLHSESERKTIYHLAASQNGQKVFILSTDDLLQAGYSLDFITPCLIEVRYGDSYDEFITCDAPKQSTGV